MDGTTLAVQHWLKGIKEKGEIRSQFCHVIDVAPTALEVAGLPEPTIVNSVQQAPVTPSAGRGRLRTASQSMT
jgi:arylsulfatase A-like enzyme